MSPACVMSAASLEADFCQDVRLAGGEEIDLMFISPSSPLRTDDQTVVTVFGSASNGDGETVQLP